ncbi:hypothetical protein DPEC_G00378270, partial [Dallia pectoralis]
RARRPAPVPRGKRRDETLRPSVLLPVVGASDGLRALVFTYWWLAEDTDVAEPCVRTWASMQAPGVQARRGAGVWSPGPGPRDSGLGEDQTHWGGGVLGRAPGMGKGGISDVGEMPCQFELRNLSICRF